MDVVDKIAKLLALAESPNEHEAQAALLKARILMAEHKLRPDQVQQREKVEVLERATGISCTKTTNLWAVQLACVVATNYCCKSFRRRCPGAKTVEVCFLGLAEDLDICESIFKYAYSCVVARCKEIRAEYKGQYNAASTRNMANSYGVGFCAGLSNAFKAQAEQKTAEWGLVMVVPQVVQDAVNKMGKPSSYGHTYAGSMASRLKEQGHADGLEFNPSKNLTDGKRCVNNPKQPKL